jgi:hypothetical protein
MARHAPLRSNTRCKNVRSEHSMADTDRHAKTGTHAGAPHAPHENPEKDPDDWTTGDEPMTGPQRSYLRTLCQEAGETFDDSLTKAEASKRIDELQRRTGRGEAS